MSCGNNNLSPACGLCPKTNSTHLNSWCNDNCYYDYENGTCRERKSVYHKDIERAFLIMKYLWHGSYGFRNKCY